MAQLTPGKEFEGLNMDLRLDQIDFRAGQTFEDKGGNVYASILAYKDARVDMQMLDDHVGQGYWQNEYKRDSKGILQCGIGVWVENLNDWVWKWSNGTPSDFEAEKGEYSDALKRAGFMWGIGRGLYDYPRLVCTLMEHEYTKDNNKIKLTYGFKPNSWMWTREERGNKFDLMAEQFIGQKKHFRLHTNPQKAKKLRGEK